MCKVIRKYPQSIFMTLLFLIVFIGGILFLSTPIYSIPISKVPSSFIMNSHQQSLNSNTNQRIEFDDEIYVNLKKLLTEERLGWRFTIPNYVPAKYYFNGDGMNLQCHENFIVVSFNFYGLPISLVKGVNDTYSRIGLPLGINKIIKGVRLD